MYVCVRVCVCVCVCVCVFVGWDYGGKAIMCLVCVYVPVYVRTTHVLKCKFVLCVYSPSLLPTPSGV